MLAIKGTYYNGTVKLENEIKTPKPVKIILTFVEEIENKSDKETKQSEGLKFSDFGWLKTRELLKDYKGSFSDTVIEERSSSR